MKGLVKRILGLVLVLLIVITTVDTTVVFADSTSNTTPIKRSETISGYRSVTSDTRTVNFKLKVKREDDYFTMYQLADMEWENQNGIDNLAIDWIPELKTWLADPENGFTDAKYATPLALGLLEAVDDDGVPQGDEEAVVALLRAIREDDALMAILNDSYKVGYHEAMGNSNSTINANYATVTKVGDAMAPEELEGEAEEPEEEPDAKITYNVEGMQLGLCFVNAVGGTRTYQPVLLNLVPKQVGPTGHWYLKNNLNYSLKYEDVKLTKSINGERSDIVRVGEIVDFHVNVEIPQYMKKTDGSGDYQYDTLNAFDDMSQGYTLIPTSAVLKFYDKDYDFEKTESDPANAGHFYHPSASLTPDAFGTLIVSDEEGTFEAILATGATVFYQGGVEDGDDIIYATPASTGNYNYWGSVNGNLEQLGTYADTVEAYTQALRIYNQKLGEAGYASVGVTAAQLEKRPYTKSLISIKLNYKTMMDTLEVGETHFVPYMMGVDYKAAVNNNMYIGNNSNTNDVYLYYVSDSSGKVSCVPDSVVGWTYAANIVKVDGDSYEETPESPDYLEGAVFNLYKLDSIYCGGVAEGTSTAVEATEENYDKFHFYKDVERGYSGATAYAQSRAEWIGTVNTDVADLSYTDGELYTLVYNYIAGDAELSLEEKVTTVKSTLTSLVGKSGAYDTLDQFSNKYGAMADETGFEIFQKYILPNVASAMDVKYIPEECESCDFCDKPHNHIAVYSLINEKFESVGGQEDGPAGVTVKGLDPNTYLLVEVDAPSTYNKLSTAIQFVIDPYTQAEYVAADNSYKGFLSDELEAVEGEDGETTYVQKNYEDGVYPILVKNYKGLTLPSTGGMGTLLFTIIGILIMLIAMIIILTKGRKAALKAAAYMAILVIAGAVTLSDAQSAKAIIEITLNNQYGSLTSGADKKTSFKVLINDEEDQLEVYRIADVTWIEERSTYSNPTWILQLRDSLPASADFAEYATPELLGEEEDVSVQIAFLDWIYTNKATNGLNNTKVATSKLVKNTSADVPYIQIKDVDYGIYLVRATNGTKTYQLLTVNAIPTQQGPVGAWYIADDLTANLKFSDINVTKTIDGEYGKTVSTDQKVTFEITAEVPMYQGVEVENGDGTTELTFDSYTFAMTDSMSNAFKYDEEAGYKVEYTDEKAIDGETEWTTLSSTYYTGLFSPAAPSTSEAGLMLYQDAAGNANVYCKVSGIAGAYTLDFYHLNSESGVLTYLGSVSATTLSDTLSNTSSTETIFAKYKDVTGINTAKFTRKQASDFRALQNITFDYDALHTLEATYVRVTYDATVTAAAVVGADTNTNTATFYYKKNLAGDIGNSTGKAYAWTYAMNLTKIDGDKATYLPNAKFKMYKEAYIYVPSADELDPTDSDHYDDFVYLSDVDGTTTNMPTKPGVVTEFVPEPEPIPLDDLALLEASDHDVYFRIIGVDEACADDDDECKATGAHEHILVYEAFTYKNTAGVATSEIVSVGTEQGVTISGLAPASYVLIETAAPNGYNKLQEAIRFEITELEAGQAEALELATPDGKDSLRGFLSDKYITYGAYNELEDANKKDYLPIKIAVAMDTELDTGEPALEAGVGETYYRTVYYRAYKDGVYPIQVKNYQGITLPSTGGMGTMLFTIIGIMIMSMAIVVVVLKKKSSQY